MIKKYGLSLFMFVMVVHSNLLAQGYDERGWFFGLGYNFVVDSGVRLDGIFDFENNWNTTFYPNRLAIGYQIESGFTFQGISSNNILKAGKVIDGIVLTEDQMYWALDGMVTYELSHLFASQGWFDPYLQIGGGLSSINKNEMITLNAGVGSNFWISKTFAININTMGKWGVGDDSGMNHIQNAIGVVYKLNSSKKQPKPILVVEEVVVEEAVVEEAVVETVIIPEPTRVVVPVKSQETLLREEMEAELSRIEDVYYEFNSSYMTAGDKHIVDKLVLFMKKYPTAVLEIQSNSDSRGTEGYNLWLSKRRAERIVAYLERNGIDSSRLKPVGLGKEDLLYDCNDKNNPCTPEQQKENRRTDYKLVWD